jgi:hypothetical protein
VGVLERTGLALTGASCGLFVAAHVGRANIDLIGSAVAVLAMMIYGAAGFYLGIDLPPAPADQDFGGSPRWSGEATKQSRGASLGRFASVRSTR